MSKRVIRYKGYKPVTAQHPVSATGLAPSVPIAPTVPRNAPSGGFPNVLTDDPDNRERDQELDRIISETYERVRQETAHDALTRIIRETDEEIRKQQVQDYIDGRFYAGD